MLHRQTPPPPHPPAHVSLFYYFNFHPCWWFNDREKLSGTMSAGISAGPLASPERQPLTTPGNESDGD